MRKVFNTTGETVEAFLNGKEEGRNKGGNLKFYRANDSTWLTSYSTDVAVIKDKYPNIIFRDRYDYSNTTRKQLSYLHTPNYHIIKVVSIYGDVDQMLGSHIKRMYDNINEDYYTLTRKKDREEFLELYYNLNKLLKVDPVASGVVKTKYAKELRVIEDTANNANAIAAMRDMQRNK